MGVDNMICRDEIKKLSILELEIAISGCDFCIKENDTRTNYYQLKKEYEEQLKVKIKKIDDNKITIERDLLKKLLADYFKIDTMDCVTYICSEMWGQWDYAPMKEEDFKEIGSYEIDEIVSIIESEKE